MSKQNEAPMPIEPTLSERVEAERITEDDWPPKTPAEWDAWGMNGFQRFLITRLPLRFLKLTPHGLAVRAAALKANGL